MVLYFIQKKSNKGIKNDKAGEPIDFGNVQCPKQSQQREQDHTKLPFDTRMCHFTKVIHI